MRAGFVTQGPHYTADSMTLSSTAADRGDATGPVPVRPVVLVVDDAPLNRLVLARMLGRLGYDVIQARDGLECLQICHSAASDSIAW